MKEFLNEKGIFIDVEIYSSTGNKYRLSELLTEYAQTLQLRQCAVSRQSEQFNCLGENYAKGIDKCLEWCGEDMCQKPSN